MRAKTGKQANEPHTASKHGGGDAAADHVPAAGDRREHLRGAPLGNTDLLHRAPPPPDPAADPRGHAGVDAALRVVYAPARGAPAAADPRSIDIRAVDARHTGDRQEVSQ